MTAEFDEFDRHIDAEDELADPNANDEWLDGDWDEDDLGVCPYFARHERLAGFDPQATCSFGCVDEPQCVTFQPREGWPSALARWGGGNA